jgi:hypothetical protein
MANRDLLKEAIADAKTVKETAIANAKVALEEIFTPYLKERLAAKLIEMDEVDEAEEMNLMDEDSFTSTEKETGDYGKIKNFNDYSDNHPLKKSPISKYGDDETKKMGGGEIDGGLDLDELLRELDELEEDGFGPESTDGTEGESTMLKKALDEAEGKEDYEDSDADGIEDSEDEEVDIEGMSEDDLKNFIEGVIADMVASGELEGGEGTEGEEHEEPDADNMGGPSDHDADNVEEKMEMMYEVKKLKKEVEEAKKAKEKAEKELKEALSTVSTIRTELQEVNLFNAKLLYTNKIFKSKTLSESQKVKVLAAFDKAASVKEAKLVFETLSEGFVEKKAPMNESLLRGSASKATGVATKKPIIESNDQVARWQKLAGIK